MNTHESLGCFCISMRGTISLWVFNRAVFWKHTYDIIELEIYITLFHFYLLSNRQFIFIVSFTLLIVQCIDYPLLFRSTPAARNITHKIHFNDVIQSPKICLHK